MFENRSQQSKTEVNARTERIQNSRHEQTCFLLKNIAGRKPETTRIVVQSNLYPNLDRLRVTKKTLEITKIVGNGIKFSQIDLFTLNYRL